MVAESAEEMQVCQVACLTVVWSGGSVELAATARRRSGECGGTAEDAETAEEMRSNVEGLMIGRPALWEC